MGGGENEPRSPKHSDFCPPNGLLGLLVAKHAEMVPQEQPADQAFSRECVDESEINLDRDFIGISSEPQSQVDSMKSNMQSFEEEFHTVEDDDLDPFFDAAEMSTRLMESNYRSIYNIQLGLILCKEELQLNVKKDVWLPQSIEYCDE